MQQPTAMHQRSSSAVSHKCSTSNLLPANQYNPPQSPSPIRIQSSGHGICSSLLLTDVTSSMITEKSIPSCPLSKLSTVTTSLKGSQRSLAGSEKKRSSWFWRSPKSASSKASLSISTSKSLKGGDWTEDDEAYSGVVGYRSKTSTLNSTVETSSCCGDEDQAQCGLPVPHSSSIHHSGKKGSKFMRFWRSSFSTRSKKFPDVHPGHPPPCMTQSGLEILAGKHTNIAKMFATPISLRNTTDRCISNGKSKMSCSFESLDSTDTLDSNSTSELSEELVDQQTNLVKTALPSNAEISSISSSNQKPPLRAGGGRSISVNSRPRYHSGTLRGGNSKSEIIKKKDETTESLDRHKRINQKLQEKNSFRAENTQKTTHTNYSTRNFPQHNSTDENELTNGQNLQTESGKYLNCLDEFSIYPPIRHGTLKRSGTPSLQQQQQQHFPQTYQPIPASYIVNSQHFYSQHDRQKHPQQHIYDNPPDVIPAFFRGFTGSTRGLDCGGRSRMVDIFQNIGNVPASAPATRRSFAQDLQTNVQFQQNQLPNNRQSNYEEEEQEAEDEEGSCETLPGIHPPTQQQEKAVALSSHREEAIRYNCEKRNICQTNSKTKPQQQGEVHRTNSLGFNMRSKLSRRQTFTTFSKDAAHGKPPQPTQPIPFEGSLNLKRVARPDLEHERHRDTSLRITIHESKNLPSSKRYFCDVCLDRKLYARTTSKLSQETVFWGECFELNNLTELNFITINLYKEADSTKDSKRRKASKSQNQLIAYLTIAVSDLSSKHESQCWHTMRPASNRFSTTTNSNNSLDSLNSMNPVNRQPTPFDSGNMSTMLCSSDSTSVSAAKRSISLVGPPPTASSLMGGSRLRKGSKFSVGSDSIILANNSSSSSNTGLPQIRLAVQYESVEVLPLCFYDELRKIVVDKSVPLVEFLEPLLPTKKKAEIAKCLVNIHEKAPDGNISSFLTDVVDNELNSYDDLSLLFRSNSIGSKAVESYIKLVGAEYLQKLFRKFIANLIASPDDLEVDPNRLPLSPTDSSSTSDFSSSQNGHADWINSTLLRNQLALANLVKIIWKRLQDSLHYFPANLRETLASIREAVEGRHGPHIADQLVSGCLFLRYLCPALHGPSLFGLNNAQPDDARVSRNFTLIAKVIQTIANFSAFEAKENYMRFMNDYVVSMQDEMHAFLRAVSSPVSSSQRRNSAQNVWIKRVSGDSGYDCHECIDLGYELTMLHRQLYTITKTHQNLPDVLNELPEVLISIQHVLSLPSLRRSASGLAAVRSATSPISFDQSVSSVGGSRDSVRFQSTTTPPVYDNTITTNKQMDAVVFYNHNDADFNEPAVRRMPIENMAKQTNGNCLFRRDPSLEEKVDTVAFNHQTFFGDYNESGDFGDALAKTTVSSDLAAIAEVVQAPRSDMFPLTKISSPPPRPPLSVMALRTPSSPPPIGIKGRSISMRHPSSRSGPPLTSPVPTITGNSPLRRSSSRCSLVGLMEDHSEMNQKWPSGPDMRSNQSDVVNLNFPPPPPLTPLTHQQASFTPSLSGSTTNIRMGTRAIRMSRERDLSGTFEHPQRESVQLSTVPVILQCTDTLNTLESDKKLSSPSNEYDTASSSELSLIPDTSKPILLLPSIEDGFVGTQSVYVTDTVGPVVSRSWRVKDAGSSHSNAREATIDTDAFIPASVQRSNRRSISSTLRDDGRENVMNRAHNFLFGGQQGDMEDNVYQNFQRPTGLLAASTCANGETVDSSNNNLEALENRLRVMEDNLSRERKDMQYVVASNIRLIDNQERCINELVGEIKRLKMTMNNEKLHNGDDSSSWTSNVWR